MAVANLLKLAVLLIGFFGYLTGSQQPSEDARSVVHNYRNKRSIYLNSKAPILIGNLSKKWNSKFDSLLVIYDLQLPLLRFPFLWLFRV